jgi:hypothetical protein
MRYFFLALSIWEDQILLTAWVHHDISTKMKKFLYNSSADLDKFHLKLIVSLVLSIGSFFLFHQIFSKFSIDYAVILIICIVLGTFVYLLMLKYLWKVKS